MLDVFDVANRFGFAVLQSYFIILKVLVGGNVHVLIDGGAEDGTGVLAVEGRKVGATANEADPKGSAGNDHDRVMI